MKDPRGIQEQLHCVLGAISRKTALLMDSTWKSNCLHESEKAQDIWADIQGLLELGHNAVEDLVKALEGENGKYSPGRSTNYKSDLREM